MHTGDLAGRFSDLEITWLLYCAGAATAKSTVAGRFTDSDTCLLQCNAGWITQQSAQQATYSQ